MSREDYGWLLDRLRELVLQVEALVQERRPVAAVQTPRGTEYTYSDGTRVLWQVDPDGARASEWAELPPLPGTRRDREFEKPFAPADYSLALDGTTALAAVVEAAQTVWDEYQDTPLSVEFQRAMLVLRDALAALERQQGERHARNRAAGDAILGWLETDPEPVETEQGDFEPLVSEETIREVREVAEERRRDEEWVPLEERYPEEGQRVEFKGSIQYDTIIVRWYRGDDPERWGWTHWRPVERQQERGETDG